MMPPMVAETITTTKSEINLMTCSGIIPLCCEFFLWHLRIEYNSNFKHRVEEVTKGGKLENLKST